MGVPPSGGSVPSRGTQKAPDVGRLYSQATRKEQDIFRKTPKKMFFSKGAFFWAYSRIGIVGISQTIVRSRATLISEWL